MSTCKFLFLYGWKNQEPGTAELLCEDLDNDEKTIAFPARFIFVDLDNFAQLKEDKNWLIGPFSTLMYKYIFVGYNGNVTYYRNKGKARRAILGLVKLRISQMGVE